MSNKIPPNLALPQDVQEERERTLAQQQQVLNMRNNMAGEMFVRAMAENLDPQALVDDEGNDISPPLREVAALAAFCLTASMTFFEVAGMVRRIDPDEMSKGQIQ